VNIKELKKEKAFVIILEGRLDSTNSGELEKKFISLLEKGEKTLLVDFAALDYISSAGLRVMLMAAKKSKAAGGKVALASLTDNVKEVFDIAGFSAIFPIFTDQEEAIQSF